MTDYCVAGFWRRTLAAVIDACILGAVGWLIAAVLFDFLVAHPFLSRLLGFVITLVYFVTLESPFCGGQSLGKRAVSVRVTKEDGTPLAPSAVLGRCLIAAVPFFLNNLYLPYSPGVLAWVTAPVLGFLVFGVGLSQLYLYCFNRKTGQSLADVLFHARVLRQLRVVPEPGSAPELQAPADSVLAPPAPGRLGRGHLAVVVLLLAVPPLGMIGAGTFGAHALTAAATNATGVQLADVLRVHEDEGKLAGVVMASLNVNKFATVGLSGSRSGVEVQSRLQITGDPMASEALLRQALPMILDGLPGLPHDAIVTLVVTRGFDMGIARGWVSHGYRETVDHARLWLDQPSKSQTAS